MPQNLPYLVLKHPNEKIIDKTFQVRRQYLIEALKFLIQNSEDYKYVKISYENSQSYPKDDIIQNMPQIHSTVLKMPHEKPSAANPESTMETSSTVDMPFPVRSVLENMESAMKDSVQQSEYKWPSRNPCPVSEFIYVFFFKIISRLISLWQSRHHKSPFRKKSYNGSVHTASITILP